MISSMLQYIQKSPDCFHAVENLRQITVPRLRDSIANILG